MQRKSLRKIVALIVVVVTMTLSGSTLKIEAEPADTWICDEFLPYVNVISNQYHLCPEMVMAIIEHESSGQVNVSNGNCKGLMQIYEKYHMDRMKKLGVTDLYDPYSNILVGCDYLAELFSEYEDMGTVLMVYNGTKNAVSRGDAADYTTYALGIMERTYELEEIHGKHQISQTSVG